MASLPQTEIDIATLKAKGLAMTDAEELLPVCFRCGATNNLAGYQVKHWSNGDTSICAGFCKAHARLLMLQPLHMFPLRKLPTS